MFNRLPKNHQATILCVKIQEIDVSEDYSEEDKAVMRAFYRKKLRKIEPKRNF